jgi:ribosome-binding factor A
MGKHLNTRLTPSLEFIQDALPDNADAISALLREARERDAAVAGIAASATYAGDADPYVKPRDELDTPDDDAEIEADEEGAARSAEADAAS